MTSPVFVTHTDLASASERVAVRVPLRVTLAGGGADLDFYYSRFGAIGLSGTVGHHVRVSFVPIAGRDGARLVWKGDWNIDGAVAERMLRAAAARVPSAFRGDIVSTSDCCPGTGLGSSGAFCVALVAGFAHFAGLQPSREEVAAIAYEVESAGACHLTGKQDPWVASLGGLIELRIAPDGEVSAEQLHLDDRVTAAFAAWVRWFAVGSRRTSHVPLSVQRRGVAAGDARAIEAMHQCQALVLPVRDALLRGDMHAIGLLFNEHWQAKTSLGRAMVDPDVAAARGVALDNGAVGVRLVGAGGSGHLAIVVPPVHRDAVTAELLQRGHREVQMELGRFHMAVVPERGGDGK